MRSVLLCFILKYLLTSLMQWTAFGHVHSLNFELKYHPIKCFNQTRVSTSNSRTDIHVDCSSLQWHRLCLSHSTHPDVFHWLGEYYKDVMSLYLEDNCITVVPVLPYFPNITLLKYKYNKIESIEDGAFNNLPRLENLDLSHNLLTELRRGIFKGSNVSFRGPPPLKSLHLGYNKITSIDYETFEELSTLQELHLNGNPLGVIDPFSVFAIRCLSKKSLQVLNLAKTGISSFPVFFLEGSKIRALYLNGNKFSQVPPELIHAKETLEFLNINENPITVLNSESFFALNNLKEIVASGMNNLTDVNGGTFLHLKQLEKLTLSLNRKLSFIDPNAFCSSPCTSTPSSVKIVYLNHNNLHYLSEDLLPWDQLETLSLSNNPWVCDWKNAWMKNLNKNLFDDVNNFCVSSDWPYGKPFCDGERRDNCTSHLNYTRRQIIEIVEFFSSFLYLGVVLFCFAGIFYLIGTVSGGLIGKNLLKRLNGDCAPESNIKVFTSSIQYNKLVNKPSYEI